MLCVPDDAVLLRAVRMERDDLSAETYGDPVSLVNHSDRDHLTSERSGSEQDGSVRSVLGLFSRTKRSRLFTRQSGNIAIAVRLQARSVIALVLCICQRFGLRGGQCRIVAGFLPIFARC
jgi:hypothetical protein